MANALADRVRDECRMLIEVGVCTVAHDAVEDVRLQQRLGQRATAPARLPLH